VGGSTPDQSFGRHSSIDRTRASHARHDVLEIEDEAISLLRKLLDPVLPIEERERRIRRLIEGPPEFSEERVDLPKHEK